MILYLLDLIGVGVFAISGALAAGKVGLDLLGVMVIGSITAIGGGTLRDLLLGRHPIFWIRDSTYLIVTCGASLFTVACSYIFPPLKDALLFADALGLALFAMAGAQIAEELKLAPIIIVLMVTMTRVAAGVVRDVLTVQIPLILRRDIYATAAIVGILLYLLFQYVGVKRSPAFAIGLATIGTFRLLAIAYSWQLPIFKLG
jgi:uncharacterized membrane protein YeiH